MAKTSMEIVMSEDLKQRLHTLAARTGKTVQEFAQEALFTYVEDIEDGGMSDIALVEEGLEYLLPEGVSPVGVGLFNTRSKPKNSLVGFLQKLVREIRSFMEERVVKIEEPKVIAKN